jgi:hypothetical protein
MVPECTSYIPPNAAAPNTQIYVAATQNAAPPILVAHHKGLNFLILYFFFVMSLFLPAFVFSVASVYAHIA